MANIPWLNHSSGLIVPRVPEIGRPIRLLRSQDSNFISQNECYESTNFFDNYCSTNDLAYNYFPKCVKKPIARTWRMKKGWHEPIDEFLPSFGNLTSFGLVKQKKSQWECEKNFGLFTSYEADFRAPRPEDYKFDKFLFPKVNCVSGTKSRKQR
nr:PREDICTED: uncharacterized protein LOC103314319 isoform X2 [Tribolium castaneum]|eukprot:XP_015839045.1 PREDICTED: uncharacterized protein LOC103314319 isoform X2 [Tribolium castaneum]